MTERKDKVHKGCKHVFDLGSRGPRVEMALGWWGDLSRWEFVLEFYLLASPAQPRLEQTERDRSR